MKKRKIKIIIFIIFIIIIFINFTKWNIEKENVMIQKYQSFVNYAQKNNIEISKENYIKYLKGGFNYEQN